MARRALRPLLLLLAASVWPAAVQAGVFEGFPDAIVCQLPPSAARPAALDVVLYVDARSEGGPVIYKPLGQSAITVEIDGDGMLRAPRLKDCDGQTVKAMRGQGRAFDFR